MTSEHRAIAQCVDGTGAVDYVDITEALELISTEDLYAIDEDGPQLRCLVAQFQTGTPELVIGATSIAQWLGTFLTPDETSAQYSDDSSVLAHLGRSDSGSVRYLVAGNPFAPRPTINRLCRDRTLPVAIAAASHPRASYRGHLQLISDARDWPPSAQDQLASAIASNPSATVTALRTLRVLEPRASLAAFIETRLFAKSLASEH